MEGKTVILSVFLMTLVMTQIQVEATELCCRAPVSKRCLRACLVNTSRDYCLSKCGCKIVKGKCPPEYPNDILENSVQEDDAVNEYCKVGCVSSTCNGLTTLQISDASEIVNGAVDQCTKACSTLCAKKGSKTTLETA